MSRCVLQPWVQELSLMQQTVLLTAIRGPDGLHKNHISKILLHWYRRCILISAFDGKALQGPYDEGGGSFTGPCPKEMDMADIVTEYLSSLDEIPHHFQLHLMHAIEILGYKCPNLSTKAWWHKLYWRLVRDAHLNVELEDDMDNRLGDNEANWREAKKI